MFTNIPSSLILLVATIWLIMVAILMPTFQAKLINSKPECNVKRMLEVDKKLAKFEVFGKHGRAYPENEQQIKRFCEDTHGYINAFEKLIKECLYGEMQNMAKVFLFSSKRTTKQFCGKRRSSKINKLLQVLPCINPLIVKDKCVGDFRKTIRDLIAYDIGGEKIKQTCCASVKLLRCFSAEFEKLPCTNGHEEDLISFIRSFQADLSNFACGDYVEGSDRCDNLAPPPKSKYDPKSTLDPRIKSFIMAAMAMFETMTNQTVGLEWNKIQ